MTDSLPLKYRPQSFGDMIGQKMLALVLQQMVSTDSVPHGLLFSGPSGTGKTTSARILAAELNPDQREAVAGGFSSSVLEIDAASNGGVGDIRKLLETLRYSASGNDRKVVIFDECHSITREGWNALLKPTEEESGVYFIFVTTEPQSIQPTVLSRLHEFPFKRVTPNDLLDRLIQVAQKEQIELANDLLSYLSVTSGGNVRTALTSLDQVARAKIKTVEQYETLRGLDDEAPALAKALLTGDYAEVFEELDRQLAGVGNPHQVTSRLLRLLTDLLVIRSGGTLTHVGPSLQARKDLAVQIEQERVLSAMKIMWDLKTRLRASDDPAGDVRLVLALMADLFSKGKTSPQPVRAPAAPVSTPEPEAPRKLSLSELRQR